MTTAPDSLRTIVGARIRAFRRARRLSAQQLADRLDWPLNTLINYEYGRRPLHIDRLAALAETLAVPPILFFVADAATADVIAHLVADPSLAPDVTFFLETLHGELANPSAVPADSEDDVPSGTPGEFAPE
jgi:transcriptional regulator with XRE-family HTH domain